MTRVTLDPRVAAQLGGATQAVTGTHDALTLIILALRGKDCPHQGVHHFAVINEGRTVLMSETAVDCLRAQAVDL